MTCIAFRGRAKAAIPLVATPLLSPVLLCVAVAEARPVRADMGGASAKLKNIQREDPKREWVVLGDLGSGLWSLHGRSNLNLKSNSHFFTCSPTYVLCPRRYIRQGAQGAEPVNQPDRRRQNRTHRIRRQAGRLCNRGQHPCRHQARQHHKLCRWILLRKYVSLILSYCLNVMYGFTH